jgi:hypothetical protein
VLQIPKYEEILPGILGRLRDYLMSRSEVIGKIASLMNKESHVLEIENDLESFDIESIPFDPDFVENEIFDRFIYHWQANPWKFKGLRNETWYLREEAEKYLHGLDNFKVEFNLGENWPRVDIRLPERKAAAERLFNWYLEAQEAYKSGKHIPDIPRDIVSDDEIILTYDLKESEEVVWIITGDIKLAREYAIRRFARFGSRYRTFRLHPKYYILVRCQLSRIVKACAKLLMPKPTDANLVIDQGSFDTAFSQMRGVPAGELTVRGRSADGKLKANRNRLIMVHTETVPLLPYEEYHAGTSRIVEEFHEFQEKQLIAVLRNAEMRVSAFSLGRLLRESTRVFPPRDPPIAQ